MPMAEILPFAERHPEDLIPGKPLFYASAFDGTRRQSVTRVLVDELQDGRPTKIEGNPLHPGSQGAVPRTSIAQASILEPLRSRARAKRLGTGRTAKAERATTWDREFSKDAVSARCWSSSAGRDKGQPPRLPAA